MPPRPPRPRPPGTGARKAPPGPSRSRSGRADRGLGGEQVEGRQAVRELLAAGRRRVREVVLAEGMDQSAVVTEIIDLATTARVPVRRVSRARLDELSATDAPQGVVARAAPLEEADLDDLVRTRGGRVPFLVVVDGVTDPHNLGALLRTAECAGVTGAVLPRHRAVHITPAAAKAAAGAVEHLPIAVVGGLPAAMADLRKAGVWTIGLEADAGQSLFDLTFAADPVALVLGAEGRGLSRLVRERCDVVVSIPQRGTLPSLNVAAAAAVACFELGRRRPGP